MILRLASATPQTVEEAAVDRGAVADVGLAVELGGRLHRAHDRQVEDLGELPVALVLARHGHDRPGAVAHQHVVGDADRDRLIGDRVGRVGAGEHAGLLRVSTWRSTSVERPRCAAVLRDGVERRRRSARPAGGVPSGHAARRQLVDQRMLGRKHHERRAEQRVGARREDADRLAARRHGEVDQRAFAAADPVALHRLDRVGPVEQVEVVDQPVGVGGDPHHPLPQRALEHREVAAVAAAVGGDLLVGQHRAQPGAPVHRRLGDVGQAVARRRPRVARSDRARPSRGRRERRALPTRSSAISSPIGRRLIRARGRTKS